MACDDQNTREREGRTWRGCVVAICAALLLAAAGIFGLADKREDARRSKCRANLRCLGVAFYVFATDHDERFPKSLAELFPRYVQDGHLLVCPSARKATVITYEDLPAGAEDASGVFTDEHTDYEYVAGLTPKSPTYCVLAHDKIDNHDEFVSVLFLDGHVRGMTPAELQQALERTCAGMRQRALPAATE